MKLHLLNLCLVAGNIHLFKIMAFNDVALLLDEKFPTFRILLELLDRLEEGTGWNYTRSDRASRPRRLESSGTPLRETQISCLFI